jgi:hypothetical protein
MNKGKCMTGLTAALALVILGSGLAEGPDYLQNLSSIPAPIAEFYEDYNFVTSFSTPAERDILIDHFSQESLPENIRTNRMNRIFRLMKRLYSCMTRIDPKMVQFVGPRKPYIKYYFSAELLDIEKVDRAEKKAVLEISVYSLEPEFVSRYIQRYEADQDGEEKIPSDKERIESIKSRIVPRKEFHIWLYQNGQWNKAEHKNIYIKR